MASAETLVISAFCAVLTLILGMLAPRICGWAGLMDIPDARKHHARPTPLIGGLALALIVMPLTFIYAIFVTPAAWRPSILFYVATTVAIILLGLEDDRRTLSARNRLILTVIIFASVATLDSLFNVRVLRFVQPAFELGLGTAIGGIAFTTLCCVGLVNAVNMADGKNGLVIGLSLGWLLLLYNRAPSALVPMICLLIACLAILLIFNLRGMVFLGDGGVYGLASATALLAIASYNIENRVAAEELMLLFGVPVLDSFRLTYSRMKRGQSPMAADRDHFHHHLQAKFGWPTGLIVYLVIALLPAYAGFAGLLPVPLCIFIIIILYATTILLTRAPVVLDEMVNR